MSQRERRHEPYPWTWEPAALVVAVVALITLTGLQLGRTLANGLATGVWQVAPPSGWAVSVPALLAGHAAAGLHPPPEVVATPLLLHVVTGLVELLLLTPTVLALRYVWRRASPWRPRGFANPDQVEQVLGVRRLRASAHLIRPDLHSRRRTR